jgi:hypothetical protein
MLAYEVDRGMKIKHKGQAHIVIAVPPPNLENAKTKTPMMCKFILATRLGHHGTVVETTMPFDQEVELV